MTLIIIKLVALVCGMAHIFLQAIAWKIETREVELEPENWLEKLQIEIGEIRPRMKKEKYIVARRGTVAKISRYWIFTIIPSLCIVYFLTGEKLTNIWFVPASYFLGIPTMLMTMAVSIIVYFLFVDLLSLFSPLFDCFFGDEEDTSSKVNI